MNDAVITNNIVANSYSYMIHKNPIHIVSYYLNKIIRGFKVYLK